MNASKSLALVFAISAAIACSKDKSAPETTTTSTGETTTSSVANAQPSASSNAPHERHRACPSRVHGATATASDVDGGVMISVTATDDATISEIHTRAATLESAASEGHRGRFCPEMHENTTRTVTSTKNGADITLVPTNAAEVARIRTDVRERLSHAEKRPD